MWLPVWMSRERPERWHPHPSRHDQALMTIDILLCALVLLAWALFAFGC